MRNAWHFYYALIFVIKVVCGNTVLRCSPLKRALCSRRNNEQFSISLARRVRKSESPRR
ncbi:hypothetical protein CGH76_22405 [Vibrio parahaemolyticus]|nr:hypothetical protein CGH76_22405 [Vibrio parahaemolyticus]